MSIRFFTADLHLGHANICRYCRRPQLKDGDLKSDGSWVSQEIASLRAEQMTHALIRDINMRVKTDDTVVCVGDFSCRGGEKGVKGAKTKGAEYLGSLNGDWTTIRGNHDKNNDVKSVSDFMSCHIGNYRVGVQHIPLKDASMAPCNKDEITHWEYCHDMFAFMICGHVHNAWHVKKISGLWHINVGVDVNRYMPINDQEVLALFERARAMEKSGKK